jgi:hypothetical protein
MKKEKKIIKIFGILAIIHSILIFFMPELRFFENILLRFYYLGGLIGLILDYLHIFGWVIVGFGVFFLKDWVRKLTIILAIVAFLGYWLQYCEFIYPARNSYQIIKDRIVILVNYAFEIMISLYYLAYLIFFTRPKVKEQFSATKIG